MLRNSIAFFWLILLFISCNTTPEEYYDLAYKKAENGNYKEAIELLDKAIQKHPEFRPGLVQRGFCKMQLNQDLEASKDFNAILKFDADNTLALFNLGTCYYNLLEYSESVKYFSKAIKTKGALSNEPIHAELMVMGDVDNDSNYSVYKNEIRFERGCAFFKNGEFEKAIVDFENILTSNYRKDECYYWMGHSSLGLSDSIQACEYFSKSADLGFLESREEINQVCIN